MKLSPLARLDWLQQVSASGNSLGTLRVAIWLAEQANDGRMVDSIDSVAAKTDLHYNTVQRALVDLVKAGFLGFERKATQRQHAHYHMLRVTSPGDSRDIPESPRKVTLEPSRVTSGGAQGHLDPPSRVTSRGVRQEDAGGVQEEESAATATKPDDLQAMLKRKGAHLKLHGESLLPEWEGVAERYDVAAIAKALQRLAPMDRWPSKAEVLLYAAQEPSHATTVATTDPWSADPVLAVCNRVLADIGAATVAATLGVPDFSETQLRDVIAGDPRTAGRVAAMERHEQAPA